MFKTHRAKTTKYNENTFKNIQVKVSCQLPQLAKQNMETLSKEAENKKVMIHKLKEPLPAVANAVELQSRRI